MKCSKCQRDFPGSLLVHSGDQSCPICVLIARNKAHGLPAATPFNGTKAQAIHEESIKHLRATGQKIEEHEIVKESLRLPEGLTTKGGKFFITKNISKE